MGTEFLIRLIGKFSSRKENSHVLLFCLPLFSQTKDILANMFTLVWRVNAGISKLGFRLPDNSPSGYFLRDLPEHRNFLS
jgi:hypothetical protein